jgi:hypothetical protein
MEPDPARDNMMNFEKEAIAHRLSLAETVWDAEDARTFVTPEGHDPSLDRKDPLADPSEIVDQPPNQDRVRLSAGDPGAVRLAHQWHLAPLRGVLTMSELPTLADLGTPVSARAYLNGKMAEDHDDPLKLEAWKAMLAIIDADQAYDDRAPVGERKAALARYQEATARANVAMLALREREKAFNQQMCDWLAKWEPPTGPYASGSQGGAEAEHEHPENRRCPSSRAQRPLGCRTVWRPRRCRRPE